MRCLLVNYEYPTVTENCGGGGRITQLLSDGLAGRGHETRVITDDDDGHWVTWPVRSLQRLERAIETFNPDVVNGHFSLPTSLALPTLCARHGVPLVISVMGADVYDPTRFDFVRPLADRVNGYLLARADAVVTPSSDMAGRVADKYDCDPVTIHYGIGPNDWRWRKRYPDPPIDILTVCRLVQRKNLRTACAATSTLAAEGYDIRHRIVGTGPLADDLARACADSPIHDVVGRVPAIQSAYEQADLFYLPSHHEAFGLVFLEALASGLPVVTSETGGQTDIVTPAVGRTAPATDVLAQTATLRAVIDEYRAYQTATRDYVAEHFHVADMLDSYEALFRRVHDQPRQAVSA